MSPTLLRPTVRIGETTESQVEREQWSGHSFSSQTTTTKLDADEDRNKEYKLSPPVSRRTTHTLTGNVVMIALRKDPLGVVNTPFSHELNDKATRRLLESVEERTLSCRNMDLGKRLRCSGALLTPDVRGPVRRYSVCRHL